MKAYAIEVDFPDLSACQPGNTGIPYVYSFDSGEPGAHVMINALTHGNEVCGAIAVKALLDRQLRPRRGRLTLSFANVEAYQRFDPREPDRSRFVDQDFNRVWSAAVLDDPEKDSIEIRRARALQRVIDTVDVLLDLHSMHERSAPLVLSGPLVKGLALARSLGSPHTIISDAGHPEGRRMRDYDAFGDPMSAKSAVLVECGQHWEAASVRVAQDTCARFLLTAGALDETDLPPNWLVPNTAQARVILVTEPVVARSMNFRFASDYTGLETFPEAGTVIGWNDDIPVKTPYPNCVLVMPSLRQLRPGVTVVRFGKLL